MGRWVASGITAVLLLIGGGGLAGYALLDRYDFGPLVAGRVAARLGRPVGIGSLHVTPGRWLRIELRSARLDNLEGGSRPAMAEIGSVVAEIEAASILRGPVVIRRLDIQQLDVLLERVRGVANWKFGAAHPGAPEDRSGFPTLLDAHLSGDIVVRTTGGTALPTHFDDLHITTPAVDQPVRVTGGGSYNGAPTELDATFAPIATLRDASIPYPSDILLASQSTTLRFQGTMTKPFELDGAAGTLTLDAPTLGALWQVAGVKSAFEPELKLSGAFTHQDPVWSLENAAGQLEGSRIKSVTLRLTEGTGRMPDKVEVRLGFAALDLNALLAADPGGKKGGADMPLGVDRAPDTLIEAHLTADSLAYAAMRAGAVIVAGSLTPGRIAVTELGLGLFGGRIHGSGAIEAGSGNRGDTGGHVRADLQVTGLDVQALRRALGVGDLPVTGRIEGRASAMASGATLSAAVRGAHVSMVAAMTGGSVARKVVQAASLDPGALLGGGGQSALSCVLAVIDMRGGAGTVLPLRLRAEAGTVAGYGQFDLNRQTLDMTIGSDPQTTGALALDLPLRIMGPFASPTIRAVRWPAQARAELMAPPDLGRVPATLQNYARQNRCATK